MYTNSTRRPDESEDLAASAILRLASLGTLVPGTTHRLNNAFTAILSELSLLLEDRKEDPQVSEACAAIRSEVERCTRLTRGLVARHHQPSDPDAEVDLGRMTRDVERLLRDTMDRRILLVLEAPEDPLLVRGDAELLESLLITAAHLLASNAPGAGTLALRAQRLRDTACATLELSAPDVDPESAAAFREPSLAPSAEQLVALAAIHAVSRGHGGRIDVTPIATGGLRLSVAFPCLAAQAARCGGQQGITKRDGETTA